ncbi:MAG: M20/M25/M40 family metallo-hydrolase [Sphingobacteriales bacterium]|nr:M20/M25/M40 family metallo-hydrolase [Sphingobacteriales bacterium]
MKKFFKYSGIVLLLFVAFILFRTLTFKSRQINEPQTALLQLDDSCVVHLQKAIRFKTVSYDDPKLMDSAVFKGFQTFLIQSYPLVFSKMQLEKVNDFGLILHWKGKSTTAKPIVLMAHQDVVPIEEATRQNWDADPFSGAIKNGFIYGRGTIDDKGSLIALLESAELLLKQGFIPNTDIYFVSGFDEEVSGLKGAKVMAKLFENRKIKPAFVLDEGGIITEYKVPGLKKTAAVVGIAEKGYQTLQLKINIPGGHSSMPEKTTAIDEMAKAIVKLHEHPFKAEITPIVAKFLDFVGPEMPFVSKMAMANQWLFKPLILSSYSKSAAGNATIRTTIAVTIFNAGIKENLIPGEAIATVNFRTQPGVNQQEVIAHVRKAIENDSIQITPIGDWNDPKQVANVNDETFKYIQKTISAFHHPIVVAPYLVLGATDARYFGNLTSQVFRFTPFTDPEGFHGVNERIKISEFKKGISFYYELIKNYQPKS